MKFGGMGPLVESRLFQFAILFYNGTEIFLVPRTFHLPPPLYQMKGVSRWHGFGRTLR